MNNVSKNFISIDWFKAVKKPNIKQSVEGRVLLELKSKIDYLEKKLGEKTDKTLQMKEDIVSLSGELNETKSENQKLLEKRNLIIRSLNFEIEGLQKQLGESNSKVSRLEKLLSEKEINLTEKAAKSEHRLTSMSSALESAFDKILDLENNLKSSSSRIALKDEEIGNIKAEKSSLTSKLNEIRSNLKQKDLELQELRNKIDEKNRILEEKTIHLKKVEEELEELKPPDLEKLFYSYEARNRCPNCSAVGKYIKEIDDKDKVLSYVGNIPMYAKKYVCKNCKYEWK